MSAANILVVAATGSQGAGVIRSLSLLPFPKTLHALTRDPASSKSQSLVAHANANTTIQLYAGDFDDYSSIAAAAKDCSILFLNVLPTFADPGRELTHVKNCVEAFLGDQSSTSAGQKWVMYSSGIGSDASTDPFDDIDCPPLRAFNDSKTKCLDFVQARCKEAAVACTVLQPGHFYSNWLPPMASRSWPDLGRRHVLRSAHRPELKLPCLDQETLVGDVVAKMIEQGPEANDGVVLPLVGEDLTVQEIADILNRVLKSSGRKESITVEFIDEEDAKKEMAAGNMMLGLHLFLNRLPRKSHVSKVREYGVDINSFEAYFKERSDELVASLA